MTPVSERVAQHFTYLKSVYPDNEIIFTALHGSQNYLLSTPNSDVDTHSMIMPTFKQLVLNEAKISKTVTVAPSIEQATIKDPQSFLSILYKAHPNFLEVLYTPYIAVNGKYEWFYRELKERRDRIVEYNYLSSLRSINGNFMAKYREFDHVTDTNRAIVEKFQYNPKQLHHQVRYMYMFEVLLRGGSMEEALLLNENDRDFLLKIKRGVFPIRSAQVIRQWSKSRMDSLVQSIDDIEEKVTKQDKKFFYAEMSDLLYELYSQVYLTKV